MSAKHILKKIMPRQLFLVYYWVVELLWAALYGFPARGMKVLVITGTKGKSSTAYLATRIFEDVGIPIALLSTIEFRIKGKGKLNDLKMTQPGRKTLQSFLRRARSAGVTHVIAEVTSEGIMQSRHRFLFASTALFTNLSPEHIEAHGGFERYKAAKQRLFQEVARRGSRGTIIVNADDPHAESFKMRGERRLITYRLKDSSTKLKLHLPGEYNQYNALAAMTLAESEGISRSQCLQTLASMTNIPGRGEYINEGQNFSVIVDYAHTPDSLKQFYGAVAARHPKARMICVLGSAGGGRDAWRRPELGKIAAEYCDVSIITNEDPYAEDPQKIIDEVKNGAVQVAASNKHNVLTILDRREAIARAIHEAYKGDVVVITGKGSEQKLMTADGPIDWDDRVEARRMLRA